MKGMIERVQSRRGSVLSSIKLRNCTSKKGKATRSENADNESNETWNIVGNEIFASEDSEISDEVIQTVLTTRRGRTINIVGNKIFSTNGGRVGIGKIGKKYCYNLGVLICLLVLILGLAIRAKRPATQGTMSRLTILISYGGRWDHSTYQNYKTKGVLVSEKITFEQLQNKVYDTINLDPNECEITIKVIYDSTKNAWPVEIASDDDVRAFIVESLLRPYKIPLCITLKCKPSIEQATVDFRQLPMLVDLNLGTRADLEDNNQCRDSENYLGKEEL